MHHGHPRLFLHPPAHALSSTVPPLQWVEEVVPELRWEGVGPLVCWVRGGDLVYVPVGWAVQAVNVAGGVSVVVQFSSKFSKPYM